MKGDIQVFNNLTFETLQRPGPKMLGKKEENGVSNSHVPSKRQYARITPKHVKKGHLVKSCHFTPLRTYAQPIVNEVKGIST